MATVALFLRMKGPNFRPPSARAVNSGRPSCWCLDKTSAEPKPGVLLCYHPGSHHGASHGTGLARVRRPGPGRPLSDRVADPA